MYRQPLKFALTSMSIMHNHQLIDFLESGEISENDFALNCYISGASNLVHHVSEFDLKEMKSVHSYQFKDFYVREAFSKRLPYFVLFIPGKSYLLYWVEEKIEIWVCFTNEPDRGQGLIYTLLKGLRSKYPDKEIEIDTFSNTLKRYCSELSINIFER